MAITSEHIELKSRDVTLHVRKRVGTDAQTPPLILLHGWPASSRGWERVVRSMSHEGTVVFPDLRGLGLSERKGTVEHFTKHEIAKDIIALIDVLGYDNFYIGGQDWGGSAAQEVALLTPKRAEALMIMNINLINNVKGNLAGFQAQMASPLNPRWYIAFQSAQGLAEAMIPGSEDAWVRYFFANGAGEGASIPEDLLSDYVDDYRRAGTARSGANYYRAMPFDTERWMSLARVKFSQPSLLIYGDQDPFLTPEFYQNYEDCFENIQRVDLPGGHFIQDERPKDVAKEIDRFIGELNNKRKQTG